MLLELLISTCILLPLFLVVLTGITLLLWRVWLAIRPHPPLHKCPRCGMLIEGKTCPVCGKVHMSTMQELTILFVLLTILLFIEIAIIAILISFFMSAPITPMIAPSPFPSP